MQLLSYLSNAGRRAAVALASTIFSLSAAAFSPNSYPQSSPLASGKWVLIAVPETGLYRMDAAMLRSAGFSDASRVRVYGTGGSRMPDILSERYATDVLPLNHSEALTDGSLVFFGYGADHWEVSTGTRYHNEMSPYTKQGYYLLTEAPHPDSLKVAPYPWAQSSVEPSTDAICRMQHEQNISPATEVGPLFLGEDMTRTRKRDFTFATPGRVENSDIWIETQFAHFHTGSKANLQFYINDVKDIEQSTDAVPATTVSNYVYGSLTTTRRTVRPSTLNEFKLSIAYQPSATPKWANLDYICVNYTRKLDLAAGDSFDFWLQRLTAELKAPADARVWRVEQFEPVCAVETRYENGVHKIFNAGSVNRRYVAWTPSAKLPKPSVIGGYLIRICTLKLLLKRPK